MSLVACVTQQPIELVGSLIKVLIKLLQTRSLNAKDRRACVRSGQQYIPVIVTYVRSSSIVLNTLRNRENDSECAYEEIKAQRV